MSRRRIATVPSTWQQEVITKRGSVPINELTAGDKLLASNGKYEKITGLRGFNKRRLEFRPYLINGKHLFSQHQSIVANNNVTHVKLLEVGDKLVDQAGKQVTVTSVERIHLLKGVSFVAVDLPASPNFLNRLYKWLRRISPAHTYYINGLLVHNASRFWVGGTGNWDGTNTANWSALTGGATGASVPTSADAVTLDSNSGAAATVTIITTGANAASVTVNKSDITLTHSGVGSTVTGAVTLTTGTLNTNGQTCSWGSFTSNNANTRTLTLGASNITVSAGGTAWQTGGGGTMTVTANTANITLSGASAGFSSSIGAWGGTISFTGSGAANCLATGGSLGNLTRTGTAVKTDAMQFSSAVTISGTLTLNGNSINNRLLVQSNTPGTQRIITAGTVSASNADFQDIKGAGAANWDLSAITGASGDAGGNSTITLTPGAPQYRVGATSVQTLWADATKWASSTGGSGGTGRVPLPQDDAIFDNNTTALNINVLCDMPRACRNFDFSGYSRAGSVSPPFTSLATVIYGSYLPGTTVFNASNSQAITFSGRGSFTLASNNTFNGAFNITAPTGTYTMLSAITSNSSLALTDGTLNDGGFSFSCSSFNTSSGRTRALVKSGAWSLTNTGISSVVTATSAGFTLTDTGSFTITTVSANTRTFAGGGLVWGTLSYIVNGSTGTLVISGANSFTAINFSDATNARTLTLPASTTTTITNGANFNVNGTAGKLMTINSSTGGTAATLAITTGTVNIDYTSLQDITASVTTPAYAGSHSTNVSGNTNWVFGTLYTKSFADSVTNSDATVKSVTANKDDSQASIDALVKTLTANKADSVTNTDSTAKTFTANKADTVTNNDALVKSLIKVAADSQASSDSVVKSYTKKSIDTVTSSDSLAKAIVKALLDSSTASDLPRKLVTKYISDVETETDNSTTTDISGIVIAAKPRTTTMQSHAAGLKLQPHAESLELQPRASNITLED